MAGCLLCSTRHDLQVFLCLLPGRFLHPQPGEGSQGTAHRVLALCPRVVLCHPCSHELIAFPCAAGDQLLPALFGGFPYNQKD